MTSTYIVYHIREDSEMKKTYGLSDLVIYSTLFAGLLIVLFS